MLQKAKEYELNQDGNRASIIVRKQWHFSVQKNKQASTQTVWGITGIGNNQACAEVSVLQVKDIKSWAKLTSNNILMTTIDCMYNHMLIGSISLVDRPRALLYSSQLISFRLTICEITNISVKTTNFMINLWTQHGTFTLGLCLKVQSGDISLPKESFGPMARPIFPNPSRWEL